MGCLPGANGYQRAHMGGHVDRASGGPAYGVLSTKKKRVRRRRVFGGGTAVLVGRGRVARGIPGWKREEDTIWDQEKSDFVVEGENGAELISWGGGLLKGRFWRGVTPERGGKQS